MAAWRSMAPGGFEHDPWAAYDRIESYGQSVEDAGDWYQVLPEKDIARFMSCFERGDGCWEWKQRLNTSGYAQFFTGGRRLSAHRVAYELFVAPIPDGLQIDHLCNTPHCVNPAHLEPVTQDENMARAAARRHFCLSGRHELRGDNVEWESQGDKRVRRCRACRIERVRRARAASKGWNPLSVEPTLTAGDGQVGTDPATERTAA